MDSKKEIYCIKLNFKNINDMKLYFNTIKERFINYEDGIARLKNIANNVIGWKESIDKTIKHDLILKYDINKICIYLEIYSKHKDIPWDIFDKYPIYAISSECIFIYNFNSQIYKELYKLFLNK